MRTTLDISEKLLNEVIKVSKAKTKKGAIVIALNEYLKLQKKERLKKTIGNYNDFSLTIKDLEKMRNGR